jgi:hypothetical protein
VQATRSEILRLGAGAIGALVGGGLLDVSPALAAPAGPKPIAGGFSASFQPVPSNPVVHVFQPLKGGELNTIGDFNGFVAATEIQGMATGSDGSKYSFDCDMRFMQGNYVGTDGKLGHGTFGFI